MSLKNFFIAQTVLNDNNATLLELLDPPYEQLHAINIMPSEIRNILRSLTISKASGPDLISPRLLREGADQLCIPLSNFFNRLIQVGVFTQVWKHANVTPIFKKGNKQIPNNYRPISLLSELGKTMERSVHKHFYNYCTQNQVFPPH